MITHKTLEAARATAKANNYDGAVSIIKLQHASDGEAFVIAKCGLAALRNALSRKPMTEIVSLIDEYNLRSGEELAAERELAANTVKIYLSSRGWGDYSPVEWIGDIRRAETDIMAECRQMLNHANDVDVRLTDEQIAAKIIEAKKQIEAAKNQPTNPIDSQLCPHCHTVCYGDCLANNL